MSPVHLKTIVCYSLIAMFAVVAGRPAAAQPDFQSAHDLVSWTATATPQPVTPGEVLELSLRAKIAEGWKMYALDSPPPSRPSSVSFNELPAGVALAGDVFQTDPKEGYDPNFDAIVRYFEKEATLAADFTIGESITASPVVIKGTVNFMICNERMCLPPTRWLFTLEAALAGATRPGDDAATTPAEQERDPDAAPLDLTGNDATPLLVPGVPGDADNDETESAAEDQNDAVITRKSDYEAAREGGLWAFLVLAVGAGLAALLMPCVFPMIPLTVSYFTKHAHDRAEALRMALVYGFAIVLTFTGLGVLMAFLVGAAGAQTIAANPWVNLFIGIVFIIFAFSLLGLFELQLPSGLVNYFNKQSNQRAGYMGVLFMGFTLTLVSFSCTAPFVGGLLAATAGGAWSYPILGMLVFSTTFAMPFVLFALFPRGLSSLPRSGSWMVTLQVVLGFIELAAALKFLSNADLVWGWNLISRPLAISLSVVIFFLAGLYLIGKMRLSHEPAVESIGVGRLLASIAFFGISLYLLPGLFGAPLNALDAYLPPRHANDVSLLAGMQAASTAEGVHGEEDWFTDDIEGAFAQAQAEGKPVFVDFTGYTCTNCRQMEANVFPRPRVAERFERDFVLLRVYTDGLERGEEFQRFQFKLTGTVALPTYAIVSPYDRDLVTKVSGIVPESDFVAFLDKGAASFAEQALASVMQ